MKLNKFTKISILIIILGTLLRLLIGFINTPAGDSCWYFQVARHIARFHDIPVFHHYTRTDFSFPPFFHILAAMAYLFFNIFGIGDIGIRLISPIFGSLTLVMCFLIAKKLFTPKIAMYSTFFVAFIPLSINISSLVFLDGIFSFFLSLAVLLFLNKKYTFGSVIAGLAMFSKLQGFVILPILIFILFKNEKIFKNRIKFKDKRKFIIKTKLIREKLIIKKKLIAEKSIREFIKKSLFLLLISLLIASPLYVRNYLYFGNPVYPYLSNSGGMSSDREGEQLVFSRVFNFKENFSTLFLDTFGVPNGNYKNLFFYKIPFQNMAILCWVIINLIFLFPFIFTKVKFKENKFQILLMWILCIIPLYIITVFWDAAIARSLLPAFPAIGIIWAIGLDNLKKYTKFITYFLIFFGLFFSSEMIIRTVAASNSWHFYDKDFEWAIKNTKPTDIFVSNIVCLPYNIDRTTYDFIYFNELASLKSNVYIWVNKEMKLDYKTPDAFANEISRDFNIIYSNNQTSTLIYKYDKDVNLDVDSLIKKGIEQKRNY